MVTKQPSLEDLIRRLKHVEPGDRIGLREPILAFGEASIAPLVAAATRQPNLVASISAWLVVLVGRLPDTRSAVRRALADLGRGRDGSRAQAAMKLLGAPPPAKRQPGKPGTTIRRTAESEVHARILRAAREGRILTYSELETSRGHVGRYLFNISRAEADLGHPPLTSIVVSKTTGLPGDGFLPAMIEVGFAHRGERLEPVWKRAVAEVHAFWAEREPESPPEPGA
jgi:hypothetical protein